MNNTELVQSYRQQISNVVNQANLQLFWNMYNRCGGSPCPMGGGRADSAIPACRGADFEVWGRPVCCPGCGLFGVKGLETVSTAPVVPTAGLGA